MGVGVLAVECQMTFSLPHIDNRRLQSNADTDQKGSKVMLYVQVTKLRERCGLCITAYFLHHREAVWS